MRSKIMGYLPDIVALRHHLHQHPELRYEEIYTAKRVAETLQGYGYETMTGIGKTGVVAVLDSGKPGKTVALRADMDALPITEVTGLAFASRIPGVMHACGHDGHTATLLLVARLLKDYRAEFSGKIKFIFQPAEEGGNGAAAMIKDGVLDHPTVDAIFAYHNAPKYPKNQVMLRAGCMFAGSAFFGIHIKGVGGHSSAPHRAVDPILVGSSIVQNIQAIVSRNTDPHEAAVISITQFNAGSAENVIPAEATLRGSIRFLTNESLAFIQQRIEKIAEGIAASFGATVTIEYPKITPPTINTAKEADLVEQVATQLLGKEKVVLLKQNRMATEDFSFYLQKIPGCYVMIGTGEDRAACHSPEYQFDDEIIPVAAELLARTALEYINNR